MQSGDYYAYLFPAANKQSGDHCSRISKLEKSPSEHGDGPPFQNNIHLIFKPKPNHEDNQTPITQFHVKFNDEAQGREDHLGRTTESFQVKEHHDVGRKVHVKEDINTAAGDFIIRKHKTYEMEKLMSMRQSDRGSYEWIYSSDFHPIFTL